MRVLNKRLDKIEKAEKITCPRCRGFGSTSPDRGENCILCEGKAYIWSSVVNSGWYRVLYAKMEDSKTW